MIEEQDEEDNDNEVRKAFCLKRNNQNNMMDNTKFIDLLLDLMRTSAQKNDRTKL